MIYPVNGINPKVNSIYCPTCFEKSCNNQCVRSIQRICSYSAKKELLPKKRDNSHDYGKISVTRSSCINFGAFRKEIKYDDEYDLKNIEIFRERVIGYGLYGNIYLGKHIKNNKYLAVKQMDKISIRQNNSDFSIVKNEITIHSKLFHDNIIKVFSSYEDEQSFYLIMDYASNGTLNDLIIKSSRIEERLAFKYFIQVVSAVNFLHENELVHRDIKPENILLDDNNNVKLCDFGWCAQLNLGNRLTFCGTYEYMAPEMIKEIPYSYSIDIWSLGILLFELIEGYSPFNEFKSDNHNKILKRISNDDVLFSKEVTNECQDLIRKLLSKNEKNRINMKEILSHPWVIKFEKGFTDELSTKNASIGSNYSLQEFKNTLRKESNFKLTEDFKSTLPKEILSEEEFESLFDKVVSKVHKRSQNKIKNSNTKNTIKIPTIDKKTNFLEKVVKDIGNYHLLDTTNKNSFKKTKFDVTKVFEENENNLISFNNTDNKKFIETIDKDQYQHSNNFGKETDFNKINPLIKLNSSKLILTNKLGIKENINDTKSINLKPQKKPKLDKNYLLNNFEILEKSQKCSYLITTTHETNIKQKPSIWNCISSKFTCEK